VVVPGSAARAKKEVRQNLKFENFAQVDSVLSADGGVLYAALSITQSRAHPANSL
jgi:hypothetical protein